MWCFLLPCAPSSLSTWQSEYYRGGTRLKLELGVWPVTGNLSSSPIGATAWDHPIPDMIFPKLEGGMEIRKEPHDRAWAIRANISVFHFKSIMVALTSDRLIRHR